MTALPAALTNRDYPPASALVKDVSGLVSPPDVCTNVFQLMRSSTATATDFAGVIGRDPNLTVRLLRVANSSFYGLSTRVETVSRAVTVIGMQQLYSVVIAVSAVSSFNRISSDHVDMDSFWRHSVFSALVSRNLAEHLHTLHPERLFVAGLMHDIGSLIIFKQLPELAGQLIECSEGDEDRMYLNEREVLGYSHADVGSLLLTLWSLPPALHGAVRGHHDPSRANTGQLEASIVRIANKIAAQYGQGMLHGEPVDVTGPDADDWAAVGLSDRPIDPAALVEQVGEQFTETVELIAAGS